MFKKKVLMFRKQTLTTSGSTAMTISLRKHAKILELRLQLQITMNSKDFGSPIEIYNMVRCVLVFITNVIQ